MSNFEKTFIFNDRNANTKKNIIDFDNAWYK